MLIRYLMLSVLFALMLSVLSCSSTPGTSNETLLERNWGRSYESARYLQIIDPEAGKNLDPPDGLNGNAADSSVRKYEQSFKEKQKQEIVNVLKLQ